MTTVLDGKNERHGSLAWQYRASCHVAAQHTAGNACSASGTALHCHDMSKMTMRFYRRDAGQPKQSRRKPVDDAERPKTSHICKAVEEGNGTMAPITAERIRP